jgi:hypothetical protein
MNAARPPRPQYINVYKREGDMTSGLLCKYDPVRGLVELQERGQKYYVDLARLYAEWLQRQVEEQVDAA